MFSVPFNIEARTQRIVIDILETTSPDLDVFVGRDSDLNSEPDYYEISDLVYVSGSSGADELIDIIDPEPGTYWIVVHNFGSADDAEDVEPIYDVVKFSVTNVNFDDDSMTVEAPASIGPGESLPTRVVWNRDMGSR